MKKIFILLVSVALIGCGKSSENKDDSSLKNTSGKKIKIVEYFDFGCGHCRQAAEVMPKIKKKFDAFVTVEQKHFPLRPETFFVAEASECARVQGKFQEFYDQAFKNFGVYSVEKINEIAGDIGLDKKAFSLCVSTGIKKTDVQKQKNEGQQLGITGTPSFVIDGILIPGMPPADVFIERIEKILKDKEIVG